MLGEFSNCKKNKLADSLLGRWEVGRTGQDLLETEVLLESF